MDIKISSIEESVADVLHAAGYMDSTINQYRKYFRYLEKALPGGMFEEGSAREWADAVKPCGTPYGANETRIRKRVVRIALRYTEQGRVDLSVVSNTPAPAMPESSSLLDVLTEYIRDCSQRGLAQSTKDYYWRLARDYCLLLESSGIFRIEDAKSDSVLTFLSDMSARWSGTDGQHIVTNFRPFLKYLGRDDLIRACELARPTRRHSIVLTLSEADEEALVSACCNGLTRPKDAAITLLALTTGMRACDIVNLKVTDIDWRSLTISLVQQKTGNPLTVPIMPALADTLATYLLEDRPDADCSNVFVKTKAPHTPFSGHAAIYAATKRVFRTANVVGAGTLLLRHNAASKMLRSNVALPVISAVLGHADPDTTSGYMEADTERMRACVLPLPKGVIA